MVFLSYILSGFVFFVSFYGALYFCKGRAYIPLISWFLVATGSIYGLAAIYIFDYVSSGGVFNNSELLLMNEDIWWMHGVLCLFLIIAVVVGWLVPVRNQQFYAGLVNKTFDLNEASLFRFSIFLLLLSFLLRVLYVKAYGGFLGYLEFNRAIRSGVFLVNNPYSFLQPFGNLALVSSYFFAALLFQRYKIYLTLPFFILSMLFSLYVQYSYSGRVGFIVYLGVIVLSYLYYRRASLRLLLILVFMAIPIMLALIYQLSNFLGLKGADSVGFFIIKETSHLFRSFFAQINDGYLYRGFVDILLSPLHFLPSSWLPSFYEDISQVNTALILGAKKGEGGVYGGIPVDILTLGLMQLNVFGVLIVGFIFGWLLKRFDFFISLITLPAFKYTVIAYFSLRIAFMGTLYAHPAHFMSGLFVFFFMFVVLYCFSFSKNVSRRNGV